MGFTLDPEGNETRAIHELVDFRGKDVLEIGCGDGRLTWRYADVASSVLALDPKTHEIEAARANTPAHLRGRVTFADADVTRYDLGQGQFDVAVLAWSL